MSYNSTTQKKTHTDQFDIRIVYCKIENSLKAPYLLLCLCYEFHAFSNT